MTVRVAAATQTDYICLVYGALIAFFFLFLHLQADISRPSAVVQVPSDGQIIGNYTV